MFSELLRRYSISALSPALSTLNAFDKPPRSFITLPFIPLIILFILKQYKVRSEKDESTQTLSPEGINLDRYFSEICPRKDELISERVWMKDDKITTKAFASRVLLAINCEVIDQKFARELLSDSPFRIIRLDQDVFSLEIIEGSTNNEY